MSDVRELRSLPVQGRIRERARLRSVHAYGLGAAASAGFSDLDLTDHVAFALDLTGAECAVVTIIDDTRATIIAAQPTAAPLHVDRAETICARMLYATGPGDVFVTGDASVDPDLWDHPWVCGIEGSIRFYAGAALIGREGLPLGMLCVWSTKPLSFDDAERAGQRLVPIRDSVLELLDARRATHEARLAGLLDALAAPQLAASARQAQPIDAIIDDGAVRTQFQPIVKLSDRSVVGFEALSRGPAGTDLESPMALLEAARSVGRLGELDWLCRTRALCAAAGSGLPPTLSWFINVEPAGLEIDCPAQLRPVLDHACTNLRVVLEVVERDVEDHVTRLLHATDQARRDAWGVALDDVGAEAASLALLPFLQPDVVKLDMSLLREAPTTEVAEITSAVRAYAERTGAVILAEGIETEQQEELARIFGATYGQGYLFGRPDALPTRLPAPPAPIPLRQRPDPLSGVTPFEALNASITAQPGSRQHLQHIFGHLRRHCEHTGGAVMLTLLDNERSYLDQQCAFDRLAEGNALTVCLTPNLDQQRADPRYRVGPLPEGCRLAKESAMIVVSPQYAGALVTRATGDSTDRDHDLVDYIYTQDRGAVIAAGRAYLDQMKPGTISYPDSSYAITDNSGVPLPGRWTRAHPAS